LCQVLFAKRRYLLLANSLRLLRDVQRNNKSVCQSILRHTASLSLTNSPLSARLSSLSENSIFDMLKKLPPDVDFNTIDILKQLANTNRALAELKGYADTIPIYLFPKFKFDLGENVNSLLSDIGI
jgi:hypothetical protein